MRLIWGLCSRHGSRDHLQLLLAFPDLFEEITFPLGPRSLEGKWIICAQDWPSIIDEDKPTQTGKTGKHCINFHVGQAQPDVIIQDVPEKASSTQIIDQDSTVAEDSESKLGSLTFDAPENFRPGVPYNGKVKRILQIGTHTQLG